jgi:hypothetical protein
LAGHGDDPGEFMNETKHLVTFTSGDKKVLTSKELADLDPAEWIAQEPADRARFIVIDRMVDRKPKYIVHDRENGDEWSFDTAEEADKDAEKRNGETK